jgi:hypothetical protein
MWDALEKIIGFVPTYVVNLLALVQGPKRFVAERLSKNESQLENALAFLTVSFLIGWILKASFSREENLFIELGSDAVFVFVQVLAYGAAICLAWRIVKGRADFRKFFVIHFYYTGVLSIILGCWFMTIMGTLRAGDPDFYRELLDATYRGNIATFLLENAEKFQKSPVFLSFYLVWLVGLFIVLTWTFAVWGAYRELNHLSKFRSVLAAAFFILFWFPVTALSRLP